MKTDDDRPALSTHQKALKINLDPERYGTFAEIGAGQEVARWFFKVGAAAATISKSMSAYDMAVSDAIYGRCKRYVSRERLQSMLDHEHGLNMERLRSSRGDSTAFFVFADTVSARNFQGTNECHGWMGVKYQAHPRDDDSQITMHVRMLDDENGLQQEALGIAGVNLLYEAIFEKSGRFLSVAFLSSRGSFCSDRVRWQEAIRHKTCVDGMDGERKRPSIRCLDPRPAI